MRLSPQLCGVNNSHQIKTCSASDYPDLASVAVVVIFLALAGDQSRPVSPAGEDGLLAPGAPGSLVPAKSSEALALTD